MSLLHWIDNSTQNYNFECNCYQFNYINLKRKNLKSNMHLWDYWLKTTLGGLLTWTWRNFTSYPPPACVIALSFDVFPQSVVIFDYKWRENVVTVTCDVIDFKGAASNTYKVHVHQGIAKQWLLGNGWSYQSQIFSGFSLDHTLPFYSVSQKVHVTL